MIKKTHSLIVGAGVSIGILAVVLLATTGLGKNLLARFQNQNQSESELQQRLSLEKAAETIAAVEKLMELPNEEPTVATVSDLATLQGQPFFARAEEGDRVLFYTQAKKAILYRPTANKIIEVAALTIPQ
jgi:hypothetical protein